VLQRKTLGKNARPNAERHWSREGDANKCHVICHVITI
jgi:hypothetical protein